MGDNMRTIIFKYGLLPPTENRERFDEQMRLGVEYKDALREVEKRRRERYQAATQPLRPEDLKAEVDRLVAARDERREKLQALRATKRKAARSDPEVQQLTAGVEEIKQQLKAARETLKAADSKIRAALEVVAAARTAAKPVDGDPSAFVQGDDEIAQAARAIALSEELSEQEVIDARTAARGKGLYVGTYQIIEQSFKAARSKLAVDKRRWYDGTGRVGVYMTTATSVTAVLERTCNFLRIDGDRVRNWAGGRRVKTSLRIRIGSQDRAPIWATFEMCYHRPLPAYSTWQFAWVQRSRIGPTDRYELMIVLKVPDDAVLFRPRGDGAGGRVAVDLGWRVGDGRARRDGRDGEGMRVAVWVGDDGAVGELQLSPDVRSQLDKADSLRAIRDRSYDAARAELRAWLRTVLKSTTDDEDAAKAPEWLASRIRGLSQWKAPRKMVRLLRAWLGDAYDAAVRAANKYSGDAAKLTALLAGPRERIDGDDAILTTLLAWAAQDHHLWLWEANSRANALGTRDRDYRTVANQLAARYSALVLEDFDLRTFARVPKPEKGTAKDGNAQRSARTDAAPSEWRNALVWSFARSGRPVRRLDPARTTLDHYVCGKPFAESPAPATQIRLFCPTCSVWVDQDENAARALLQRDQAPTGVGSVSNGAPV